MAGYNLDWASAPYFSVLLGLLYYVSSQVPVFAFARARGLPHGWVALIPALELFVLLACVGVPRRAIMAFAAVGLAVALAFVGLLAWQWEWGDWDTGWDYRVIVTPNILTMVLWMAACQDARISRGWAVLAAWPYIGGLGGWRIVSAIRNEMAGTDPTAGMVAPA